MGRLDTSPKRTRAPPFPPHSRPLLVPHGAQDEGGLPGPGDVHQVLQLCRAEGWVGRGRAGASPPPNGSRSKAVPSPHHPQQEHLPAALGRALCPRNSSAKARRPLGAPNLPAGAWMLLDVLPAGLRGTGAPGVSCASQSRACFLTHPAGLLTPTITRTVVPTRRPGSQAT